MGYWKSKPLPGVQLNFSQPLARGLAHLWLFNDSAASTANRVLAGSGVGNYTGVTRVGTNRGDAAHFTSSTNSIGTATLAGLPTKSTDDFSIEVLVRMTSAPSLAQVFGMGADPNTNTSTGDRRQILCFNGGPPCNIYFWGNSADLDSGVAWRADNSFQHVIITRRGTSMVFYRDGQQIGSGTTPSLIAAQSQIWAGSHHPSGPNTFAGDMLKSAIYNRALSREEIAWLYAEPYAMLAAPPMARYNLWSLKKGLLLRRRKAMLSA